MPCLIIGVKSGVCGFNDFGNVQRAHSKHEGFSEHIGCALGLSRLKQNLNKIEDASQENSRLYIKHFNENVQLNRRFIQLPICAVLFLGKKELAFCGQQKTCSILFPMGDDHYSAEVTLHKPISANSGVSEVFDSCKWICCDLLSLTTPLTFI
ncbi:hypothetical protein NQ317_010797 [Molorchus minor]|uniref:Uncharacterized protein n=1 Tax=Molorchus minor TaxID=1323400 RepID=A0ABQ9ITB4_9CUCU|nr:hypothetical protein NQ317_010797 [Molorchus minor]